MRYCIHRIHPLFTSHIAVLAIPGLHLSVHGLQEGVPLPHAALVQLAELADDEGLAQSQRILKMRPHLQSQATHAMGQQVWNDNQSAGELWAGCRSPVSTGAAVLPLRETSELGALRLAEIGAIL